MARTFFRPHWTCGRYNCNSEVAIMYNLIAGFSYFFESDSAKVIGELLEVKRGECVDLDEISSSTLISVESLESFFSELLNAGLVCESLPSSDDESEYRKNIREYKLSNISKTRNTTKEKLPFEQTSAEAAYTAAAGGITSVMFELTYRCSEKCIHCYNLGATRNDDEVSHRGDREELEIDDYKRIIDELYEQGLIKVCLSGGDPFSKSIIWDIIDYLYNKEIAFDIFTNGQKLAGNVSKLASYYPRSVGVSIYSGISEVHDYITRVKGSWTKSIEFISKLSELAVPINIKCCIMRPNVKSYYMISDIAREYGAVPQYEICICNSLDGDKCASNNLLLTSDQLEVVLRDDNIPLYVGSEVPDYGRGERNLDENACGAGYNSFCVTPEGFLTPCCAFHAILGDLKKDSLSGIIQNSEGLHRWRSLKLKDYEKCGKEEYCSYCNLCVGNNFSEHGDVLKPSDLNCYIAKNRYNLAMKIKNENYDPLEGKNIKERLKSFVDYKKVNLNRIESHDFSNESLR